MDPYIVPTSVPEVLTLEQDLASSDHDGVDDLLGGRAGTIVALLALERRGHVSRTDVISRAVHLGNQLRSTGVKGWRGAGEGRLLTGLSHGASGIGLALLELYAETGAKPFLTAARDAFAYEDGFFDPAMKNWQDLREVGGRTSQPASVIRPGAEASPRAPQPRFALAWCHGAPGIALARLRAHDLDPVRREAHLDAARAGLETTANRVHELLSGSDGVEDAELGPCHGLAGLVETLWIGGRSLDDRELRETAIRAGLTLANAAVSTNMDNDTLHGRHPALMLGAAGIGHTLLRLHSPDRVPSILLVH